MKFVKTLLAVSSIIALQSTAFASNTTSCPQGDVTFYNNSGKPVTAEVSNVGKVTIAASDSQTVSYSTLSEACYPNTTNCRADFYVNNKPVGYATLNVVEGKVVSMKLAMKVATSKGPEQVLRSVVIQ